jgi:hypothetical protein
MGALSLSGAPCTTRHFGAHGQKLRAPAQGLVALGQWRGAGSSALAALSTQASAQCAIFITLSAIAGSASHRLRNAVEMMSALNAVKHFGSLCYWPDALLPAFAIGQSDAATPQ